MFRGFWITEVLVARDSRKHDLRFRNRKEVEICGLMTDSTDEYP